MKVSIRHAQIEDAETIGEAEREIAKEPGYFCSQPFELTDENVKQTLSAILKDKNGVYLVAVCEGKLVGHAFLEPFHVQSLRHVADLNIAVHAGWQKKGIGTKLLEQIIEWAKNSDMLEKIQLNVRASNSAALSLYKKFNFEVEGRLKNRVRVKDRYIDDLIMGLDLSRYKPPPLSETKDTLIRAIQESDVANLINTFSFPWEPIQATTEKWKRRYEEHERRVRSVYLLEKQGQLAGYASLLRMSEYLHFKSCGIPEINDVWVSQGWRKRGLGTELIQHTEDIARREGYKQIGIGVGLYKDYGPAQKLYFKLGYMPDGKGVTYKGLDVTQDREYPMDDELILWLTKFLY